MPATKVPTFAFVLSTENTDGLTVSRELFKTKDKTLADGYASQFAEMTKTAPKLRPATAGNRRPVRLVEIGDPRAYASAVKVGLFALGEPRVGTVWPTVADAAHALRLKPTSLRQYFYAARTEAGTEADQPVTVRGLTVAYDDNRNTVKE